MKDLENRWRPTGGVADNLTKGMTDQFGGPVLEYIHDGPIEDQKEFLDKIKERKREKA